MNANELADELEIAQGNNNADELIPRSIAMLRQQQAQIEALEQSKDRLIKTLLDVRGQQPVAWGMTWKDGEIYDVISPAQHDKEEGDYNIPLYTNPVKEINDGGEPVKNATYWKRQYNLMASQNDNLKSGLYHANEQIKYLEAKLSEALDAENDRRFE